MAPPCLGAHKAPVGERTTVRDGGVTWLTRCDTVEQAEARHRAWITAMQRRLGAADRQHNHCMRAQPTEGTTTMTLTEAVEIVVHDYREEDGGRTADLIASEIVDLAREELDVKKITLWLETETVDRRTADAYLIVVGAAEGEINELLVYHYG